MELSLTTSQLTPANWRYNPDFKVPGSQHCKFLRFPGPYFAPSHDPQDPYDRFFLPEATTLILFYYVRMYDQVEENLINTGRLSLPKDGEEAAELLLRKKVVHLPKCFSTWLTNFKQAYGMVLAEMTGENYDLFSIVVSSSFQFCSNSPLTVHRTNSLTQRASRHPPSPTSAVAPEPRRGRSTSVIVREGSSLRT